MGILGNANGEINCPFYTDVFKPKEQRLRFLADPGTLSIVDEDGAHVIRQFCKFRGRG